MTHEKAKTGFRYTLEKIRDGEVIDTREFHNLMADEGLNHMLDVGLSGGTQITTWYLVLFENDHTPAAGSTYATPGFTECTSGVNESVRQQWQEGGVSSKAVTNSANKAVYQFNTTKTVYGAAIVGGGSAASTKGDTAGGGVLLSCGVATPLEVENTEYVRATATITIEDASA